MAGATVNKGDLDYKAAHTVVLVREAFEQVDVLYNWLADNPSNAPEGDLLTKPAEEGGFGYTADEAYLLRVVFEGFRNLDIEPLLEQGRKLTGLA